MTIVTSFTSKGMDPSSTEFYNASSSSALPGGQPTSATFAPVVTSRDSDNLTGVLTSTTYNYSEAEIQAYLDELQSQTTNIMLPAMVYLVLLAVFGSIGNTLVLFVYSHRFTQTATRIFILVIASFDIITNVIAIPGEIYDMFHIWDFKHQSLCKIRMFFNAFTTMASAIVLVAVAVERYRKICKPFGKQMRITHAKVLGPVMTLGCLIFSVPLAVICGRQTKQTPRVGIYGYECTLDDSYQNTIWPLLTILFLFVLFVVSCGTMVVLYAFIGIQAWRHSHVYGAAAGKKPPQKSSGTDGATDRTEMTSNSAEYPSVGDLSSSARAKSYIKKKSGESEHLETVIQSGGGLGGGQDKTQNDTAKHTAEDDDVIKSIDEHKEDQMVDKGQDDGVVQEGYLKHASSGAAGQKSRGGVKEKARTVRRGMGRTTAMLLIISVVYIVGFFPFLTVMFYKYFAPESFAGLGVVGLTFYNLFLRSYFLNSAANPVVYSLCDINFRRECLRVLKLG